MKQRFKVKPCVYQNITMDKFVLRKMCACKLFFVVFVCCGTQYRGFKNESIFPECVYFEGCGMYEDNT